MRLILLENRYFPVKWCHVCNKHAFMGWAAELSLWVGPEKDDWMIEVWRMETYSIQKYVVNPWREIKCCNSFTILVSSKIQRRWLNVCKKDLLQRSVSQLLRIQGGLWCFLFIMMFFICSIFLCIISWFSKKQKQKFPKYSCHYFLILKILKKLILSDLKKKGAVYKL